MFRKTIGRFFNREIRIVYTETITNINSQMGLSIMGKLESIQRQFLVKETIISIFINAVLNFAITFFMFRSRDAIMFWGKGGLFFDLIPATFFTTFFMALVLTPVIRSRIQKGTAPAAPWDRSEHLILRFLPGGLFIRAIVVGIFALLMLLPVSTGLLAFLNVFPILFKEMLILKTCYGALIGLLISPIIVIGAMADKGHQRKMT